MAGRREAYDAGRADERAEVVAFLRDRARRRGLVGDRDVDQLAVAIERGEHAEAVVLGAEVGG